MPPPRLAVRGSFVDFIDNPWRYVGHEADAARFLADGLLVIEDGLIRDFGPFDSVSARHPDCSIIDYTGSLITPGFIDGHIHFPQTRIIGSFGLQLLDWLQAYVFPEELRYRDRDYAREGARQFFDRLLASGTTTCQSFTTSSPVATEELFEEAARRGVRIITGLTGIDRLATDELSISANDFYRESHRLIERYHRQDRNLYAITPRYALGSTPEMLSRCRQLKDEHPDCWINTHISENPTEIVSLKHAYPDCRDYTAVYERFGLLVPKMTAGHGVWLSDDELRRFSQTGASVSFCPLSNLYLGSGLFRLGRAMDPQAPVRVSFGTDVGAGNSFCMLRVLEEAYKVGMCNSVLLDGTLDPRWHDPAEAERNKLSPYRGFWSVTLGAAQALYIDDLVGNFDIGKEADFVVLDPLAGNPAIPWRLSLSGSSAHPTTMSEAADLMFVLMVLGDDRNIAATWAYGRRAYERATSGC